MRLPIEQVRRMAAPLRCKFVKKMEYPEDYEVMPELFLYQFIVNGTPTPATRRKFFARLDHEERYSDKVEYGKHNGRKIMNEIVI